MNNLAVIPVPIRTMQPTPAAPGIPCRATTDEQLMMLWLHGKSPETQRSYLHDVRAFFEATGSSIRTAVFDDLVFHIEGIDLGDHGKYRATMSLKSLFSFAADFQYTTYNLGKLLKAKTPKDKMVERIITTEQVKAMINKEMNPRNRAILQVLYKGGLRVSEVAGLKWHDVITLNHGECRLNVYGKGNKTRMVGLAASAASDVMAIRGDASRDSPVFLSRNGGHLDQSWINRIVRAAAVRAGIKEKVSPHWLRHSCGTDLVEAGCPLNLVKDHLGHRDLKTTQKYVHVRAGASAGRFLE